MLSVRSSTIPQRRRLESCWYQNTWFIFSVALALRAALIFNFHLYRFPAQPHHHGQFGWEMGQIARAVALGRGFSDPFFVQTGPTAWVAPGYPYLMAGVFHFFGIYSAASAAILMLLNALFSSLAVFPIGDIAGRCFSRRVANGSMWLWAAWPFTMRYIGYMQDFALTTLLFTCVIALTLRIRSIQFSSESTHGNTATMRQWLLLGFLWGLIAVINPAPLIVLPASFLWLLTGTRFHGNTPRLRSQILRATLAGLLCLGCILPWTIRNAMVFHTFVPMRSDLGEELYRGNGPGSSGISMVWDAQVYNLRQFQLYRSMGEVAYCRMRGAEAVAFIQSHPTHFILDSLRRVDYFWLGFPKPSNIMFLYYLPTISVIVVSVCGLLGLLLAFRRRAPGTGLFGWLLLLYPLTYYLVAVENHHRHPITPLLYILTIYLWTSAEEGYRVRLLSPSWWRSRFARGT